MYKKLILLCGLMFSLQFSKAQNTEANYRSLIQKAISGIDLENKILFINVWQSGDFESRANNKEFIRVSNIYKKAKLKNGLKGVEYINISLDQLVSWEIALKRDTIISDHSLENSSGKYDAILKEFNFKTGSVVVNSNGEVIKTGLNDQTCFKFFNSLITRQN